MVQLKEVKRLIKPFSSEKGPQGPANPGREDISHKISPLSL